MATPGGFAPPVNRKSVLRYRGSAPINFRLILINGLLAVGCTYVLLTSLARYNTALNDLDGVARIDATGTVPCGLSVPRTKSLLESLKEIDTGAFASVDEKVYVDRIRNAFCGTNVVINALRAGIQALEILEDDGSADNGAEKSVKDYVCACTRESSCTSKHYGDFVRRIESAYVLAAPAFEAYATSGSCLGTHDPFGTSECSNGAARATVASELAAAATNSMRILSGLDMATEPWPTLSRMLYRLLVLSVVEYYDRADNQGVCFVNTQSGADALALCAAKLASSAGPFGTPSGITNASKQAYHTRLQVSEACDWVPGVNSAATAPAEPPRRDRKFTAAYATATPVHAVCSSMHEFGLLDRTRLFGLPDPVTQFQFFPETHGNSLTRTLASISYYGLFDQNSHKSITSDKHTGYLDLKLYVAYRYATTSSWVFAAVVAAGYLLAFAMVPLFKLVYIRLIRRSLNNTRTTTILLKPLGTAEYFALFTVIFVGLWILYVDGARTTPYLTSTSCGAYARAGGAYVSTGERDPDGLLALVLIILGLGLLIYTLCCRRPPKAQRVMPLDPFPIWPVIFLILIVIFAIILLLIRVGDEWWELESTRLTGTDEKTTDDFEAIMRIALIILLILGLLLGLLNQRHMAANVMLNVPRGMQLGLNSHHACLTRKLTGTILARFGRSTPGVRTVLGICGARPCDLGGCHFIPLVRLPAE